MSLSAEDALLLADELVDAARRNGRVPLLVEHWPSERTTVAVKGSRVWGPPIEVSEFSYEIDREPDYQAELERHRYAARCESGPREQGPSAA